MRSPCELCLSSWRWCSRVSSAGSFRVGSRSLPRSRTAVFATNPMVLLLIGQVRGYGLMTLCAVLAVWLAVLLIQRPSRWMQIGIGVAAGVGHPRPPLHGWGGRRDPRRRVDVEPRTPRSGGPPPRDRSGHRWRPGASRLPQGHDRRPGAGTFRLAFPLELGSCGSCSGRRSPERDDVSGRSPRASSPSLRGDRGWPGRRSPRWAGVIAVLWIVVAPLNLYPRFFIWLVPAVGGAVAWSIARVGADRRALLIGLVGARRDRGNSPACGRRIGSLRSGTPRPKDPGRGRPCRWRERSASRATRGSRWWGYLDLPTAATPSRVRPLRCLDRSRRMLAVADVDQYFTRSQTLDVARRGADFRD